MEWWICKAALQETYNGKRMPLRFFLDLEDYTNEDRTIIFILVRPYGRCLRSQSSGARSPKELARESSVVDLVTASA